jgi:MarR family transcriptional regulator, lower aerobic nicotinate degradation pathway regulator
MKARSSAPLELAELPGHHIRRLQQIAVGLFMEETQGLNVTPIQYAALHTAWREPGLDQRTLASRIGFDPSTIGGVIDRLEARGLVERQVSAIDRRARQIAITAAGIDLLEAARPYVLSTQTRLLKPLSAAERKEFMRMLQLLVEENNMHSRAPTE